jgi:RES domain-containing protein
MNKPAPGITPHKQFAEILAALDGAKDQARAWAGNGFRLAAVSHASGSKILSGHGSQKFGGRWNAAGTFPAVYCSLLPETAVTETMSRFHKIGLKARRPLPGVLISLTIKLQSVLDFTAPREIPIAELFLAKAKRENWQKLQDEGQEASGQAIGRAAHQLGIEGLLFSSTVATGATNLVVFPENLRARGVLRIENKADLRKYVHE